MVFNGTYALGDLLAKNCDTRVVVSMYALLRFSFLASHLIQVRKSHLKEISV